MTLVAVSARDFTSRNLSAKCSFGMESLYVYNS